ncbi:MAG TPA: CHAD domain-containing protein, partial [Flavitalea sp.]|nr:CHAD domain-containing protein [Flavitalea sp.]
QKETGKLLRQQAKLLHKMKKVKQRLRHRVNAISKNEIEQFFTTQISNVEQLLNSHNFGEQLHNGRKILKHVLYNRQIIPHVVAKDMNINYDEIDEIQQIIGDWHDNKVALDFFGNKLPGKNLETMKQKQEELKKTITEKADSLLKHRL